MDASIGEQEFTHHFALNGGVRLHYAVNAVVPGVAPKPALLFLHGIPGFWKIWEQQLARFAERFTVAAMDLRGFNDSDKPPMCDDYRMPLLVGDVIAVILALRQNSQTPLTLVGHDFGAIIAWWVAMLQPKLVNGLVSVAVPHPQAFLDACAEDALRYPDHFRTQIFTATEGTPLDEDMLSRRIASPSLRRDLVHALRASSAEGIRNYYRANLGAPSGGIFPRVRVPVMMIAGGEDGFVPSPSYERSKNEIDAACEIAWIAEGDHDVPFNSPAAFNACLERWLASNLDSGNAGRTAL